MSFWKRYATVGGGRKSLNPKLLSRLRLESLDGRIVPDAMPIMDPAMMPTTQTTPSASSVVVPAVMPPTQATLGQDFVTAVMPPTQNLPGQDVASATPTVMINTAIYGTYNVSLLATDPVIPPPVIPPPVLGPNAAAPTTLLPPIVIALAPPPPLNAPPDFVPTPTLIIRFNPNGPVGVFGPPFVSFTQGTGLSATTITIYGNYRIVGERGIVSFDLFPGLPTPVAPMP